MTQSPTSHSEAPLRHRKSLPLHHTGQSESHSQASPGTGGPLLNRAASLQRHRSHQRRFTMSRAPEDRGGRTGGEGREGRPEREGGKCWGEKAEAPVLGSLASPWQGVLWILSDKIQLTSQSPLAGPFIGGGLWGTEVEQEARQGALALTHHPAKTVQGGAVWRERADCGRTPRWSRGVCWLPGSEIGRKRTFQTAWGPTTSEAGMWGQGRQPPWDFRALGGTAAGLHLAAGAHCPLHSAGLWEQAHEACHLRVCIQVALVRGQQPLG